MRFPPFATVFAGTLLAASAASAASLRISPIGLDLKGSQRAASLSLTNVDTQPVSIQIRLFAWSQSGEEDKLDPATDMLVSPPVATIPPGGTYTVRVARPVVTPAPQERTYRLVIDELPKPPDPNNPTPGVGMVLRTSMPVFVADEAAKATLAWTAWQDAKGVHVGVVNSGSRHAKIVDLALTDAAGKALAGGGGLNGYVLKGVTRSFVLKAADDKAAPSLAGRTLTLIARDGERPIKETVVVESR